MAVSTKRLVILISGTGSNMEAILKNCQSGNINGEVVAVISNKPLAKGLETAQCAGVTALCVDHREYASREDFDRALAERIDTFKPDLVILAGFMRILSPDFVRRFIGRMMNIHPSLLPKYPGLDTHQRAIDAGDSEAGATVHFVTEELDGGPIILQGTVAIKPGDGADDLAERVRPLEHHLYPHAVKLFCEGRLYWSPKGAFLDKAPLPKSGVQFPPVLNS